MMGKILKKARFTDLAKDGRIVVWGRGWEHFRSWPILGVGFDKGGDVGYVVLKNVFANMYHNIGIQFLAAMGAVGGAAFLFHLWQVGCVLRKPTAKKVLLLTLPFMILTMSLVDNFFFYLNQQIAYCMFLAVAERKNL
jgi:O-antigen ligase